MKLYPFEHFTEKVGRIFEEVREEVFHALPFARIEHIGSSSIPGSLSKGDLDIFVGVPSERFEESLSSLKRIGFFEKIDTFRSNELCMLVTEKFNHDVAIQLVANNSKFENFLHFKSLLMSDRKLLERYNQIKLDASERGDDDYRSKKARFIEEILKLSLK